MTVRRADISDLQVLSTLHASCFSASWTDDDFALLLANDHIWVMGEPVQGFIVVSIAGEDSEIITIGVHPHCRQSHVGAALLAHAMVYAGVNDVTRMTLEVAIDNLPALALYANSGFIEVGRRKAYYSRQDKPAVDALVLATRIAAPPIVTSS